MRPQIVPDASSPADLDLEPDGWYAAAQADIDVWVERYSGNDDVNDE